MSKTNLFENKAFQKEKQAIGGFNLVPQINSFNSIFNAKPLDAIEANRIEKLLVDNFQPGKVTESQIAEDAKQLKEITSEIKAIGKQGIILMGERVRRAKDLLKPYRNGTFTKWIESAFSSRKTGYNMLAYYELYTALPHNELREHLKKLPQKTAYMLASRSGDMSVKEAIINEHHNRSHDELLVLIQEKLPIESQDKRKCKSLNDRLIHQAREILKRLQKRKDSFSEESTKNFAELRELLDAILCSALPK